MSAGKRDQRVLFQRLEQTSDGGGGWITSWEALFSRWAEVRPLTGRERDQAQQTEAPRNYRITVPRDAGTAGLLASDRVVWLGKVMQIRFIADAGPRPMEMMIDCEAGVQPDGD